MKKIIITISMILTTMSVFGQNINLETLPKAERDSILIARAEQAVLRYGDPEFLNTGQKPIIRHLKNSNVRDRGTFNIYCVTYLYDPYQYIMNMPFSVNVSIFANTGKVYRTFFGTGYGAFDLDIEEYDGHFSYRQSETNPERAAKILQEQQGFIDEANEYEREGVTIEAAKSLKSLI